MNETIEYPLSEREVKEEKNPDNEFTANEATHFALHKPLEINRDRFPVLDRIAPNWRSDSAISDEEFTKMIDNLAEGILHLINQSTKNNTDTIFFLDKSARPAAHLFSKTWEKILPDRDKPKIRFTNIVR